MGYLKQIQHTQHHKPIKMRGNQSRDEYKKELTSVTLSDNRLAGLSSFRNISICDGVRP